MNIPVVRAMHKLESLSNKMFSPENVYKLVIDATGDTDKAEEAYTEWVNSLGSKDKVVNIDTLGFSNMLAEIFGAINKQ